MSFLKLRRQQHFLHFMGNVESGSYDDSYVDDDRSSWNDDDDSYMDDPWDRYRDGRSPSHSNYGVPLDEEADAKPCMLSLLELSAKVTAKHVSCEEMEGHDPPLDEVILKKVAFWASPQERGQVKTFADLTLRGDNNWNLGERIFKEDKVHDMTQVGFMVTAVVLGSEFRGVRESSKVSFTFEKQRITSSSCGACPNKIWCAHLIAAILHRIKHASKVPIYAPVTETLSTLSRDQLQKLVQYAINEDPGGVLGKVFKRINQIRDVTSEINETAGAPDPTFGLGLDGKSVWDLSMEELKSSFTSACYRATYDFPHSYQESTIVSSSFYKDYLQRVVDLVHRDEIDPAGRVMIVLTSVAAKENSSDLLYRDGNLASRRYQCLLKTIVRMCSLFILQFTGDARSDLIVLCQDLNKKMKASSTHSNWAELPAVASMFLQESPEAPGVLGGKQTKLFYEPICTSITQDPNQDFYYLITGTVEPSDSSYDEPLPLMLLRFEAIRLWKKAERGDLELLRLGAVILRKLLRMTYHLTILKELDTRKKGKGKKSEKSEKGKTSEKSEKGKKSEKSRKRKIVDEACVLFYMDPFKIKPDFVACEQQRCLPACTLYSLMDTFVIPPDVKKTEPVTKKQKLKRQKLRTTGSSRRNKMSQPESRTNDPAPVISAVPGPSGVENPTGEAPETAKKKDDNSQMEDGGNEEPMEHQTLMDSQNGVDETNTTEDVNFKLNCLGKGENGVSVDMETLSKETLSFCLLHMCCCIFKIHKFDSLMKAPDNEVLASASLRALELARYRTVVENGQEVSIEEHSALNHLEHQLIDSYEESKDRMLTRSFSYNLHRLYMKMLCDHSEDYFYNSGLPLRLISFLVRNTLNSEVKLGNKQARSLCLYTLCYSHSPFKLYTIQQAGSNFYDYRGISTQLESCFSGIASAFMYHLQTYPARNQWILKLLKYYEKVKDGKALYHIWNEMRDFPYRTEPEEVQVALVKFLLNCVKRHNAKQATFLGAHSQFLNMFNNLCKELGPKFTELVLSSWEEMIKYFQTVKLTTLIETMKSVHTLEAPLSGEMIAVIMDFFARKFVHDVDSCSLLVFFSPGDRNYNKAIGLIRKNAANYTPSALLHVARQLMEHQEESGEIPLGNCFSNEVELFINFALHRLEVGNKAVYMSERNVLFGEPNADIQWVFRVFTDMPVGLVAKSRQFVDFLDLVSKTFSNDVQTILSLFKTVEIRPSLLEKCKSKLGQLVIDLINKSVFGVLDHVNHNSYARILQELDTVHVYYRKYVLEGEKAFKDLLLRIKRVYKTKKKLITMMHSYFSLILKDPNEKK